MLSVSPQLNLAAVVPHPADILPPDAQIVTFKMQYTLVVAGCQNI